MKFLKSIISALLPKEVAKPVGRWSIEKCSIKMNQKIDLSNEDHCGPCGQYALTRFEMKSVDSSLNSKKEKVSVYTLKDGGNPRF